MNHQQNLCRPYAGNLAGRPQSVLKKVRIAYSLYHNTPAMPLNDAHFGGFFVSGGRP